MIATPLLASLLALGAIASPQRVPSQMHGSINFIAVAPEITQPDAETTWTIGEEVTVTWNTDFPEEAREYNGTIYLVEPLDEEANKFYLRTDQPLAENFKLGDGQVSFELPEVSHKYATDLFAINLFGDSGNVSPVFTILNADGEEIPPAESDPEEVAGSAST